MDERPTFQGLDTPVPRIHRDERLLLDEHGSQRFALRPRPAGERLVRAVDARHEPRQSLRAAIFQAMGRVVDRVCRPGRVPRRHLPLQREGADERVVRGRTQGIPRFQHRGRMLDVVDPATGILAGRQSQQGRLRLTPAVDHGFPAAGGHLPGAAHRLAPLGRGHDARLRLPVARFRLP